MEPIKRNDTGAAVEDVQTRLARIGHLPEDAITGIFDDATAAALAEFLAASALPPSEEVTEKVWAALVDATYNLGDRTLYLRMPYFHGHDVLELQQALGALGFFYGTRDAIFGAHTEEALRRFQLNLGLPSDGIARCLHLCGAAQPGPLLGRQGSYSQPGCAIWASPVRPMCSSATPCACSAPMSSLGPWPRACRTWLRPPIPPPRSSAPTRSRYRRTRL